MKEIYRLQLDDYSAASFTSFGKDYFGTFDQMRELFNAIRCNEDFVSQSSDILTTFDRCLAGEKKITHYAAYQEVPFLVQAKVYHVLFVHRRTKAHMSMLYVMCAQQKNSIEFVQYSRNRGFYIVENREISLKQWSC